MLFYNLMYYNKSISALLNVEHVRHVIDDNLYQELFIIKKNKEIRAKIYLFSFCIAVFGFGTVFLASLQTAYGIVNASISNKLLEIANICFTYLLTIIIYFEWPSKYEYSKCVEARQKFEQPHTA